MRIGELAGRVGVSTDTIRFYERSGWLPTPERQVNTYRDYGEPDVEHLRLLIDLRRLELPLEDAARVAAWCHAGHCGTTSAQLPVLIAQRRADIAERIERLRELDARLASLEAHLARSRPALNVLVDGAPCCDAAEAVVGSAEGRCACCSPTTVGGRNGGSVALRNGEPAWPTAS
jgi:DNA-binding transcriptional MerR regulator